MACDVFEHVFDPASAIKEIYRTLRPGGLALLTFPVNKSQVSAVTFRAEKQGDLVRYIQPPEYHGNPISDQGSLVTVDYGYEIHEQLADWSSFDVEVTRYHDLKHGILGEFTEVFVLTKNL